MSKKILIHGKDGHVVVAMVKDGAVSLTKPALKFEVGSSDSTIPNIMFVLGNVLKKLEGTEEFTEIATISSLAEKIERGFVVTEFQEKAISYTVTNQYGKTVYENGRPKRESREMSPAEAEVYGDLIAGIKATYGTVLVKSEQYITKSLTDAQGKPLNLTADQLVWANLFTSSQNVIETLAKPVPRVMEAVISEDPDIAI